MKKLLSTTIMFFLLGIVSNAQISEIKLLPGDGAEGNQFGNSVSISGDYLIVGAWYDDDNGIYSGSAYLFKRNGGDWIEEQKLTASDGTSNDGFGTSVVISDDIAVIGAIGDDDNAANSGSAYIFRNNGMNWIEEQKISASDGATMDAFGYSLSISGNYLLIGAWGDDDNGENSGSAYLFEKVDTTWVEKQKVTASDGSEFDQFGVSVSISGNEAFIGAYGDEGGSVYVFKKEDTTWIEKQKLKSSDGADLDDFGISISVSGDVAIIGAQRDDDIGTVSGSAYIFIRNDTTWIEKQKLLAGDGEQGDWFGNSVSISGEYIVVGAYRDDQESGSAYIFRKDDTTWVEEQKLLASDRATDDYFGGSVSISGEYVVVGTIGDDDNGVESGSAYLYNGFVVSSIYDEHTEVPLSFTLEQNYPNPFNPSTKISWQIPASLNPSKGGTFVTLKVFDILGREITTLVNELQNAGVYEIEFNASQLSSGIYLYVLKAGSIIQSKKMVLIR